MGKKQLSSPLRIYYRFSRASIYWGYFSEEMTVDYKK